MALFAVYTDVLDFLSQANPSVETNSLIGGNTTLSSATVAGATSLPIATTAVFPATGTFTAWILDGMTSEIVSGSLSGSNLLVPAGTQVAHGTSANIVTAGTAGNLAKTLVDACRMADTRCRQGPAGVTGIVGTAATALSSSAAAGALSLTVVNGAGLAKASALLIDGLTSEVVTISGVSGTAVTLASGLRYAHSAGATLALTGAGDRTLYQVPRTEAYRLATLHANIDADGTLNLAPFHFPVTGLVSASIRLGTYTVGAIDLSQVVLPLDGRFIQLPAVTWSGGPTLLSRTPTPALRDPNVWLTLTYTGGPVPLAGAGTPQPWVVPDDIKRAVFNYTLFLLATRQNPLGAASVHQGDTSRQFELRGNAGKHNLLQQDADEILSPYRR